MSTRLSADRRPPWGWLVPTFAAVLLAAACYPFSVDEAQQLDTVTTLHDPVASFSTIGTYVVPDSIVQINEGEEGSIELSHEFDDFILAEIRSHLDNLGYIEEPDPENNAFDVAVLVYATGVEDSRTYVSYPWWDYWGWYPYWPCCGPGWGIGYPPIVGEVTYETGTLFIEMVDVRNPTPTAQEIPSIWIAAVRGLLGTSSGTTEARLMTLIDQAFGQSPYLGR